METTLSSPKQTFLNLPEDKQESIVREAIREFAVHGYQRASINNIVKRLGIAKGSVYQYFSNKESLFLHVFERFTAQVKFFVKDSVSHQAQGDFFEMVQEVLWAGIRFIRDYPQYFQIYLKVFFEQNVPHREELIHKVRLFSLEYFGPLCEEAQKQAQLRQDISPSMVVFMLDATMERFLQGYAEPYLDCGLSFAGKTQEDLERDIATIIDVLRSGLQPSFQGDE